MRTYNIWFDAEEKGKPIEKIVYNFDSSDIYKFSDNLNQAVISVWNKKLEENPKMTNEPLFNLRYVNNHDLTEVLVGQTCFRDYLVAREFLDGKQSASEYNLVQSDLDFLEGEIIAASTFPIVTLEDKFVMGIKGQRVSTGAGKLSFPGAGYSNIEKDTIKDEQGKLYAIPPGVVFGREINEEMSIIPNPNEITALGIIGDTYKGSNRGMGLLAIVGTDISVSELKARKEIAEDAWEHEGPYWLIPKDAEIISALIESEKEHGNKPLDEKIAKEIDGIGETRLTSMTGKASIALFFLGRNLFGNDWYNKELSKHESHIKLEDV
ncbi:MAG: hypothetical protein KJ767_04220 [Nanoarchaeota archaeon]|nr:hypothetical protein [Nanoarchaeota archaeon]